MDDESYVLKSQADAAVARVARERDLLKEAVEAVQTELSESERKYVAAETRALAAERKSNEATTNANRMVTEAQADARIADASRDSAERALKTEQQARLEAEARCTVLVGEIKRAPAPVAAVKGPKGWKITMDKDSADNILAYRLEVG